MGLGKSSDTEENAQGLSEDERLHLASAMVPAGPAQRHHASSEKLFIVVITLDETQEAWKAGAILAKHPRNMSKSQVHFICLGGIIC